MVVFTHWLRFFRCWSHVSQVSLNCLSLTVTFCEISCVGLDWFSLFEMPEVWPEPWSWRTDCQTERSKMFVSPKVSCWIWFWHSPKQFGSLKLKIWMTCHSNVLHVSFKLCAIHCSTQHLHLTCQSYDRPEADLSQHLFQSLTNDFCKYCWLEKLVSSHTLWHLGHSPKLFGVFHWCLMCFNLRMPEPAWISVIGLTAPATVVNSWFMLNCNHQFGMSCLALNSEWWNLTPSLSLQNELCSWTVHLKTWWTHWNWFLSTCFLLPFAHSCLYENFAAEQWINEVWMAAPFTSSETSRLYHWEWVDSYFSSTWCFSLAWFFHILSVLVRCLTWSWLIHSHDSLPAALVGSTFNNHSSVNQISNHKFQSWSGEWMKHRTKFMYHQGCMALMDLLLMFPVCFRHLD